MENIHYVNVLPSGQLAGQGSCQLMSKAAFKPMPGLPYTQLLVSQPIEDTSLLWLLDGVLTYIGPRPSDNHQYNPQTRTWELP